MQQPGKIFLGACPTGNRRFVRAILERMLPQCPRLVVPAVGTFGIVKVALEVGYKAENIDASDICVFSGILGHLYSGQALATLGVTLADQWAEPYRTLETDIERAAFLLWLVKLKQFKGTTYFDQQYARELVERSARHRERMAGKLREYVARYSGIGYRVADLRDIVRDANDPQTFVVVDPPIYPKGYTKMFTTAPDLVYEPGVAEFDYPKELLSLYEQSKQKASPFVWGIYTQTELPSRDCVFACELAKGKFSYWYSTRRDELVAAGLRPRVEYRPAPKKPPGYEIVRHDLTLTPATRISFKEVDKDAALYYRDLFAHKLGNTNAEQCVVMLLDGRVFGIVGFVWGNVVRGADRYIMEVFGFNAPLTQYPNANRLLMMAITCQGMYEWLMSRMKRNRLFEMVGLKTACLSKYRKVKLNNGLLRLEKREKWKRDLYKLLYVTEWHPGGFADVMQRYLDELAARAAAPGKEAENG